MDLRGLLGAVMTVVATVGTPETDWSRIYIKDVFVRDAVRRALEGTVEKLAQPRCQSLLSEFADARERPLKERLVEMHLSLADYLRLLVFEDGEHRRPCSKEGILAYTTIGSRVINVCGRAFARAWQRDRTEVGATVIHEMLHSLGLGENPPAPRYITYRVKELCW